MMHQVIIDVGGPKAGQFLVKILVQSAPVFDHVLGQLGRDIDLVTDLIPLENLPDGGFASGINISGVVVIDAGAEDARSGHWEKGLGMDLFRKVSETFPAWEIIAEDLGYVTDSVCQLV